MFADLHIHSQHSDSKLTLQDILKKAVKNRITMISICDHNTINAYKKEALFFRQDEIVCITGVEISSFFHGKDYHILGYGFDTQHSALNEMLRNNCKVFEKKGKLLIKKMAEEFNSLSMEEFSNYQSNPANGGFDSFNYLKDKGLVGHWYDYLRFANKYNITIAQGYPSPQDVINTIKNAGGYAVLAHFGRYTKENAHEYQKVSKQFLDMGIDGFECYYPSHTKEVTDFLLGLCNKHDLLITGGSDDHGGFNNVEGGTFYDMSTLQLPIEQLKLKSL